MLNTPLIMVLGHTECGAVTAAVDSVTNGTVYPGDLPAVIAPIVPAVQQTASSPPKAEQLEAATVANVQNQTKGLAAVELLAQKVSTGALRIVGATYDLPTARSPSSPRAPSLRVAQRLLPTPEALKSTARRRARGLHRGRPRTGGTCSAA